MFDKNVYDIRRELRWKRAQHDYTEVGGVKTIELVAAAFIADEPAIIGTPNKDYIRREIEWYNSQSLHVDDIPGDTPAIWKAIACADGKINSNYGFLIYSDENHRQYERVLETLRKDRTSRQAVMVYTRPTIHDDCSENGRSDFICTNSVQYVYRDSRLHAIVNMRSNDVVFGYRNDFAWQQHVLRKLSVALGVVPGTIFWQAGSLHVYERHFHLLD